MTLCELRAAADVAMLAYRAGLVDELARLDRLIDVAVGTATVPTRVASRPKSSPAEREEARTVTVPVSRPSPPVPKGTRVTKLAAIVDACRSFPGTFGSALLGTVLADRGVTVDASALRSALSQLRKAGRLRVERQGNRHRPSVFRWGEDDAPAADPPDVPPEIPELTRPTPTLPAATEPTGHDRYEARPRPRGRAALINLNFVGRPSADEDTDAA